MLMERGEKEEGKRRKKREKEGRIQNLQVAGHDLRKWPLARSIQLHSSQLYNHGRAQAKEWLSGGRVASTFDSRQVAPATGRHCADVKNE